MAKISLAKKVEAPAVEAPVNVETVEPTKPVIATSGGVKVFNDIPVPSTVRSGGKAKYPWKELAVNASFFVGPDKEGGTQDKLLKRFHTLCNGAGKLNDRKFIVRKYTVDIS